MNNAPVYCTVAQIRFNPILCMESLLPSIQEQMRHNSFPDFHLENVQEILIPSGQQSDTAKPPSPSILQRIRGVFGNVDQTKEFVLENNFLALQTTKYETFDDFLAELIKGLKIISDVVKPDFVERIGLRYFDAIQPKDGESLDLYLNPRLLGLYNTKTGLHQHTFTETVIKTDACFVTSRIMIRRGQIGLPMEIANLMEKVETRFKHNKESLHAILDTDTFSSVRINQFDLKAIEKKLHELHKEQKNAFDAVVTPTAKEKWQ